MPRFRHRGAGTAVPPPSTFRARRRGRPSAARRGAAGRRCRRARTGTRTRAARARAAPSSGRNGAAARPISRHASTRSPSTPAQPRRRQPRRRPSQAFASVPRLLGVDDLVRAADELPAARRARRGAGSPRVASRSARASSAQPSPSGDSVAGAAPAARRRGSGWPSTPSGSRGCRSRSRGRRCSAGRSRPTTPRRPRRTAPRASDDVAGAVGPERRDEVVRVEEVAAALAHPLAAGREQPAVDPDLARRLEPGAPQHRRPEDRVEPGDVLADDVEVGRPPALERLRVVREAGAGDVVDQRVEPDVDRRRPRGPTSRPRAAAVSPFSAIGNGIPQSPGVRSRLIEKSSRPPRMKPSISLRR